MKQLVAKFNTGDPIECIWEEEIDPVNDWVVWIHNFIDYQRHWIYVHSVRYSDVKNVVDNSLTVFYEGPVMIKLILSLNKVDIGKLAMQLEYSRALIENRPVREFRGAGVINR